jgi:hypothetical protein
MLTSAAVRWVFEGAATGRPARWVAHGSLASTTATRENHSLVLPARFGLGITRRESRFETKSLVKTVGSRHFTEEVLGAVPLREKQSLGEPAVALFE